MVGYLHQALGKNPKAQAQLKIRNHVIGLNSDDLGPLWIKKIDILDAELTIPFKFVEVFVTGFKKYSRNLSYFIFLEKGLN